MNKKANNIPPVVPGIFSPPPYEKTPPTLLGGHCPACDQSYFPRPKYCRHCLGEVREADIGRTGSLYSYTVVRIKPPWGLPSPYSVVYVDLNENNLRVFGLFDPLAIDQLQIGLEVELCVKPLGQNSRGELCLRPYFSPHTKKRGGDD
jgi:uncharacterized OB-fold protein